jgi:uroporphyrinogen decarboxylase
VPDPELELPYVMEAVRRIRRGLADEVPLIGFSGAPWTLAAYMIEGKTSRSFEKAKAALLGDPALAELLLGKIADSVALYLNAQLAAGAQALQIFDSWAGALSADDYAVLGAPYIARIIAALKRDPAAPQPVIVFGVETGELLGQLARTGADVVGVDWRVPLAEARRRAGPKVALQGNLDPASLFLPSDVLAARARKVLAEARAAGGGHVFNLGHGILPGTPVEGARHLVELVHGEN